jgi:hypothetical protein
MIAEYVVSVIVLLVSVVFFAMTFTFPKISADPGGMSLFPRVMCLIAGIGALRSLVNLARKQLECGFNPLALARRNLEAARQGAYGRQVAVARRMAWVFAFTIGYPWVMLKAGFLLSTIIYVFALMKLLGAKTLMGVVLSCVMTGMIYLFFVRVVQAYVPPGEWVTSLLD